MSEPITRPTNGPYGHLYDEQRELDRAQKPLQLLLPRIHCLYGNDKHVRFAVGADFIVPTKNNLSFDVGFGYAVMPIGKFGFSGHRFHVFLDAPKLVSFGHFQAGAYAELGDLKDAKIIKKRYSTGIELATNISLVPELVRRRYDVTLDVIASFDLPNMLGFHRKDAVTTMIGGGITVWEIF